MKVSRLKNARRDRTPKASQATQSIPNQEGENRMNAIDLLMNCTEATIVDRHDIPARPERLVLPPDIYLREEIASWMKHLARGRDHVWLHQGMALEILKDAKNIVLATGTGSGKTLVFQADTLRRLTEDPEATVLALYPAKALTSDQMARWREAFGYAGLSEESVVEIQGDVPPAERDALLKRARLIVATPDIVQAWLMRMGPVPAAQRFLRSLQLVIIDEAHNLEGVFGSNCAFLFRRLRAARLRALRAANAPITELQFVAASATIADPAGHLKALTGLPFEVIGEEHNGAPCHAKTLLHIEGPDYGAAAEANLADIVAGVASQIAPNALIAFADGRQVVERVASTIGSEEVEPFRAGFELEDRAAIAKALLDDVSISRLEDWFATLSAGGDANGAAPGSVNLAPDQCLIYAPHSTVGVRINGIIHERQLLGHEMLDYGGSQHLAYSYESAPGVKGLVFHDQVEPIGHDWRQVIWDRGSDTIREIAA